MQTIRQIIISSKIDLLKILWDSDPHLTEILKKRQDVKVTRDEVFSHLNNLERLYFNVLDPRRASDQNVLDRNSAKECIRVLKNIFRTENEKFTNFSALKTLIDLSQESTTDLQDISEGFLCEFIYLFKGINASFSSTLRKITDDNALISDRSNRLDFYAKKMISSFSLQKKGTDIEIQQNQLQIKNKLLAEFKGTEDDWLDYKWHLSHIITDKNTIASFVHLEQDEIEGLTKAEQFDIPVQITPYYLSLFNQNGRTDFDRAIRAQVIPTSAYCQCVKNNRDTEVDHDFMGEKSTSPVSGITRRYPSIVILKPYDSCPQICVYCQRNWEITSIDNAVFSDQKIVGALDWISNNKNISEVLVTGGDPLTLDDQQLDWILQQLSQFDHVERIRIGTRTLVTLPSRFTASLLKILRSYHQWGKREVTIVTHFEHPMEITPEVIKAVELIKNNGLNIYNQTVFTYYNSRRYQYCFLRKVLKMSGIDPYYSFNTKGKEETVDFRVPIARIEQERKEEARLLPGLARTDEPVFNVPRLGKSHLRAWQEHEPVMILPDGKRVFRFYPWDSSLAFEDAFLYTDVSIYDYLMRLKDDGDDIEEYESIWYYF